MRPAILIPFLTLFLAKDCQEDCLAFCSATRAFRSSSLTAFFSDFLSFFDAAPPGSLDVPASPSVVVEAVVVLVAARAGDSPLLPLVAPVRASFGPPTPSCPLFLLSLPGRRSLCLNTSVDLSMWKITLYTGSLDEPETEAIRAG